MANKKTDANRIVKELSDLINEGQFSPGEHLVEAELTRKLKTSRTTLRTAFQRLAAARLIVITPNRGATVRRFSTKDILDIEQIRALMEPYVAYEAARCIDQGSNRARLREAAQIWVRKSSVDDLDSFLRESKKFHQLLIELTGNKELAVLLEQLNLPILVEQFRMIPHEGRAATAAMYMLIIEAISDGDAIKAKRLMSKQRRFGENYVHQMLKGR